MSFLARSAALVAAGILVAGAASAQDATTFTVRVQNISKGEVLKLSNGKTAPFVSAPVLWVTHAGSANPIFVAGKPDAGLGLEQLAETGDPSRLAGALRSRPGVVQVGAAAMPVGGSGNGPLTPGQGYEFQITARPGEQLSVAWMFGQSNDLFYANDRPITLFGADGKPVAGSMTTQLSLWDAGTEVNEEPGLGPNQGPRQPSADAGIAEHEGIAHVRDRFSYPRIAEVLQFSIAPQGDAMSAR
jgi:hypothetical protein